MKKITVIGMVVLLFMCILTGCPETEPESPKKASMTFVDDPQDAAKEFTVYDDLSFRVKFIQLDELLEALEVSKGDIISGKILTKNKWTDEIVTGKAKKLRAPNNEFIDGILIMIDKDNIDINVKLTYFIDEVSKKITTVNVVFPEPDEEDEDARILADMSNLLMAGDYFRKDTP
ncbi:MAG: hypothetical protein LBU66_00610 [Treponema sp.]|jgi:hypothetical protein|nr:hypothetical protein [Treponema sp.]